MRLSKTFVATLGVALLGLGAALVAQGQRATIVMRSGEEHPALNIGYFDNRGLIVRTSFEEEPNFPIDQVAYIDFGGGSAPATVVGSPHAVVMKDGSVVAGTVTRIAHVSDDQTTPWNISITTPSGPRQIGSNDISRVYFTTAQTTAVGTGGQAGSGVEDVRAVTMDGKQPWTPTGITVRRGEIVTLRSSGEITLSLNAGDTATPEGAVQHRYDPASPLPQTFTGALMGRINNGRPFPIGSQTQVRMPDAGQLFLGINDSSFSDNGGSFRVEVARPVGAIRR